MHVSPFLYLDVVFGEIIGMQLNCLSLGVRWGHDSTYRRTGHILLDPLLSHCSVAMLFVIAMSSQC